jgi:hypothetical protein
VGDEAAVVVAESEERLQFFEVSRGWPSLDGFYLFGVGSYTLCRNDVAKILNAGFEKLTFGGFPIEPVFAQDVQDLSEVLSVVVVILAVYQDVVNVHDDAFVEEGVQNILDESLEGGRGIGETKGHDSILEVAIPGAESCLLDIIFMDSDLVIA